jgi:hypothetical protein
MKNLFGILMIIAFATVLFGGVSLMNNEIAAMNGNLNNDSKELITKYDNNVDDLENFSDEQNVDTTLTSNNTNQVDAFFRESAENKNNIEKARDGINYLWNLPSIIIISVPGITLDNSGFVGLLNGTVYFMISILLLFAFYKAVRTGRVDDES